MRVGSQLHDSPETPLLTLVTKTLLSSVHPIPRPRPPVFVPLAPDLRMGTLCFPPAPLGRSTARSLCFRPVFCHCLLRSLPRMCCRPARLCPAAHLPSCAKNYAHHYICHSSYLRQTQRVYHSPRSLPFLIKVTATSTCPPCAYSLSNNAGHAHRQHFLRAFVWLRTDNFCSLAPSIAPHFQKQSESAHECAGSQGKFDRLSRCTLE